MKRVLPTFGIDLHEDSLRLGMIDGTKKTPSISVLAEYPITEGMMQSGKIQKSTELAAEIKNTLRRHRLPKYCTAALPDDACFLLTVAVHKDHAGAFAEAVRWEAAQHLPFSIDEMYFDWMITGHSEESDIVQVSAAPKTIVDIYVETLDQAGFTPIAVEPASFAVLRSIDTSEFSQYLVIHLERHATVLSMITEQGIVMSAVSTVLSESQITQILMTKLKLDDHDAEKAKTVCGFDPSVGRGVVRSTLLPELKRLVGEIKTMLTAAKTLNESVDCKQIVLTGSGALIKNFDKELAKASGMQVSVSQLIIPPEQLKKQKISNSAARSLNTVIGLCLRNT